MILWVIGAGLAVLGLSPATGVVEAVTETVEEHLDSWTMFDSLFQKYAARYGVDDWAWLKAIALNESNLGLASSVALGMREPANVEGSKSSDGKSWGLMQVTLTTGRWLDPDCTEIKLNDPEYSIKLAADLFARNQRSFNRLDHQWLEWVVKSYNQGAGNTKKEIANGTGYANEYWARWQRNYERCIS